MVYMILAASSDVVLNAHSCAQVWLGCNVLRMLQLESACISYSRLNGLRTGAVLSTLVRILLPTPLKSLCLNTY